MLDISYLKLISSFVCCKIWYFMMTLRKSPIIINALIILHIMYKSGFNDSSMKNFQWKDNFQMEVRIWQSVWPNWFVLCRWYEELACPEVDDAVQRRLEKADPVTLPIGKLLERLMVFKSLNAKFYHDLLKIAEYRLKQIKWVLISLAVPVLKTKKVIISNKIIANFAKGNNSFFQILKLSFSPSQCGNELIIGPTFHLMLWYVPKKRNI